MIQAGIFDIGGVLLYPDAFDDILRDFLAETHAPKAAFMQFWKEHYNDFIAGKISTADFWQQFQKENRLTLTPDTESLWVNIYKRCVHTLPGVEQIINDLQKRNIKLALLSNMLEPHTNYLRSTGFADRYDVAIFSSEVGLKKPDPKIYELILQKLTLSAEEVFFVDDKRRNTEAAEEIGIKSFVFTDVEQLRSELNELGLQV